MKLVTFERGGGAELGAVVEDERIVAFNSGAAPLAETMIDLIARWGEVEAELRSRVGAGLDSIALSAVRLLAPVARPGKIMAIGLNYADHIAETGAATPARQIWFSKATTAVNGPFDPIMVSEVSASTDYEVELVAVIGKGGRRIALEDAPGAIFGWCVGNDLSERAWQNRSTQWVLGKSFDTHAPFGPWITTADEIADPHALGIRCLVNGEMRQNSNTRNLVFNVWAQIAELSTVMTLEPGDIIYTGTPGGVGAAMKPPCFLKAGDVVRAEIDQLGAIEASVASED
jgi:2-keto-4-pentenoate hydratase/2-oxohepta-3-ene-1,7-dioic acid hydratase in catechol pathway